MGDVVRKPSAEPEALPFVAPCRRLEASAPLRWLREGLADMRAAPRLSLGYGLLTVALSWVAAFVAFRWGSYWLLLAALTGFVFIAPVLCLGLYAISAQLERGQQPSQRRSFREARR